VGGEEPLEVVGAKQRRVDQVGAQVRVELLGGDARRVCSRDRYSLGARPPITRLVRADSGVLLTIESHKAGGMP
jgi:hypothetical protein